MDEELRRLERAAVYGGSEGARRLRGERWRRGELVRFGGFQTRSPAGYRMVRDLEDAVRDPALKALLLIGESGCGKSFLARAFHEVRSGASRPLPEFNAAAIPEHLHERDLFGLREADLSADLLEQRGALEQAIGSSLLISCVCECAFEVQVKVSRYLRERRFSRIGEGEDRESEVFVIAEDYPGYESHLIEGRFFEPLYAGLSRALIRVPPLRERLEDLPLLFDARVDAISRQFGPQELLSPSLREEVLALLKRYHWPGNIRELEVQIARWLIVSDGQPSAAGFAKLLPV